MELCFSDSFWQLVMVFVVFFYTEKCSIAKIIREEDINCNQFMHLEKEH